MKWYDVSKRVIGVAAADAALIAIYGTAMRYAGTAKLVAPVLEYQAIADSESELWATVTIQFDQWCRSAAELGRSELRLRRLFHQDLPTLIGGLGMWCQYLEGDSLASPDRDGYFARAIRFRFTPLRDLYQPSPTP